MGYQLGVDLGTTYTAAAICRSSDQRWVEPEVVTLGTRSATVPSVLYLSADGSILVGEAAERRALTDPDRVVREFKRRLGDPTPLVVAGQPWSAEELSARLVRWVVDRVAEREGGPAERIAVTHPASWGRHKQELLSGALAGQGLTVTFLAEPQAAALHYAAAERVEEGSTIAVYDLGGGTFDSAVVRKADPASAVVGTAGFGLLGQPEGIERLGGVDFDAVVFEHVKAGLPMAFEDLDDTDPAVLAAVTRVRRECTEAKEALSSDTDVSIPVLLPVARGSVRLHRSEFEAMIRPQIEETVAALRRAVGSAALAPDALSAVLLVGGSSRIPLVAQLVSEQLGRPVAVDADPKNAIAKGAALAISPKPTTSWPGVAIPPLAAGAGPAGSTGVARSVGAAAAAGTAGAAALAGAAVVGMAAPPPVRPPHSSPAPPARPPHDPTAFPLSASGPQPPHLPMQHPGPAWEYDTEPEPRRRPTGLLVGAGGLLAVAAIVVAAVTWPASGTPTSGVSTGGAAVESSEAPPPGTTVENVPAPAPGVPETRVGGKKTVPNAGGNVPKPPVVQPPPVVTTPKPPPTQPPPPPPTTPPPPPPPPTTPPPPTSSAATGPVTDGTPVVNSPLPGSPASGQSTLV